MQGVQTCALTIEKKRLRAVVPREQPPVESTSGAAGAALVVCVEEQPFGTGRAVRVGQRVADAQRPHRRHAEVLSGLLVPVAVPLDPAVGRAQGGVAWSSHERQRA